MCVRAFFLVIMATAPSFSWRDMYYTFQCIFSYNYNHPRVPQEGVNTGTPHSFSCPAFLLRCLLNLFLIAREVQPSLSLVNGASVEVGTHELFSFFRFPPQSANCFRTHDFAAGSFRGYLGQRGDLGCRHCCIPKFGTYMRAGMDWDSWAGTPMGPMGAHGKPPWEPKDARGDPHGYPWVYPDKHEPINYIINTDPPSASNLNYNNHDHLFPKASMTRTYPRHRHIDTCVRDTKTRKIWGRYHVKGPICYYSGWRGQAYYAPRQTQTGCFFHRLLGLLSGTTWKGILDIQYSCFTALACWTHPPGRCRHDTTLSALPFTVDDEDTLTTSHVTTTTGCFVHSW